MNRLGWCLASATPKAHGDCLVTLFPLKPLQLLTGGEGWSRPGEGGQQEAQGLGESFGFQSGLLGLRPLHSQDPKKSGIYLPICPPSSSSLNPTLTPDLCSLPQERREGPGQGPSSAPRNGLSFPETQGCPLGFSPQGVSLSPLVLAAPILFPRQKALLLVPVVPARYAKTEQLPGCWEMDRRMPLISRGSKACTIILLCLWWYAHLLPSSNGIRTQHLQRAGMRVAPMTYTETRILCTSHPGP